MQTKFEIGDLLYAKTDKLWAIGTVTGISIDNDRKIVYSLTCTTSYPHTIEESLLGKLGKFSDLEDTAEQKEKGKE